MTVIRRVLFLGVGSNRLMYGDSLGWGWAIWMLMKLVGDGIGILAIHWVSL